MEFWAVEVKATARQKVSVDNSKILQITLVSLGEVEDGQKVENVPVSLFVEDEQILGWTLSSESAPQVEVDLECGTDLEVYNGWKDGSVYIWGYLIDKLLVYPLLMNNSFFLPFNYIYLVPYLLIKCFSLTALSSGGFTPDNYDIDSDYEEEIKKYVDEDERLSIRLLDDQKKQYDLKCVEMAKKEAKYMKVIEELEALVLDQPDQEKNELLLLKIKELKGSLLEEAQ